jgi:pyrroline-5-carboxylate reductase
MFAVEKVATELKPSLSKNHLLISIAAGVTLVNLQRWAGEARVVRVMPNLPCLVGATAAALSLGSSATQADSDLVIELFEALGKIHVVDEKLLNAVTGLRYVHLLSVRELKDYSIEKAIE